MGSTRTSFRSVCLGFIFSILGCSSADVPESLWKNPEEVSNYTPGVRSLVFSPTGKHLASLNVPLHPWNMRVSSMFSTPQLHIWTIPEDYLWPRSLMSHELEFFSLAFDEQGEHLLTDAEGGIRRYDLIESTSEFAPLKSERVLALSPDGRLAVLEVVDDVEWSELDEADDDESRSVRIKNVETGQVVSTVSLPSRADLLPVFSPDSRFLVSTVFDGQTYLLEVSTGKSVLEFKAGSLRYPVCVAASRPAGSSTSGRPLLMAAHQETGDFVGVWSLETGELIHRVALAWNEVWHVAWSPDGEFLAVSGESEPEDNQRHGLVRFWNLKTGEELEPIRDDSTWGITAVAFSPDGDRLATGDGDGKIKLWPLPEEMRSSATSERH